jgi:cobalamin-dependent methionine synthase I
MASTSKPWPWRQQVENGAQIIDINMDGGHAGQPGAMVRF